MQKQHLPALFVLEFQSQEFSRTYLTKLVVVPMHSLPCWGSLVSVVGVPAVFTPQKKTDELARRLGT